MELKSYEIWFVTGSQDLYGEETLRQVAVDSQQMVDELNATAGLAAKLVWKPTVRSSQEIYNQ